MTAHHLASTAVNCSKGVRSDEKNHIYFLEMVTVSASGASVKKRSNQQKAKRTAPVAPRHSLPQLSAAYYDSTKWTKIMPACPLLVILPEGRREL